MAILSTSGGASVTIDESPSLLNDLTSNVIGDLEDNDVALSFLTSATSPALAFYTRLTALGAGTPTDVALSGYNGSNTGLNAFTIAPSSNGSITDLRFSDSNGNPLQGLNSELTTADGVKIYLYTDTANNNILLGRAATATGLANPSGAIVFAAYIEENTSLSGTGGKIWTTLYQPLHHFDPTNPDDSVSLLNKVFIAASQDSAFSLANAPSGQNLFLMFTTANPTVVDGRITGVSIIATGKNPANQSGSNPLSSADDINITTGDTINTSQAGGPTTFGTNNQMITEQEGIRFTFVTGARQDFTIPNLDQNEADVEKNIDFTAVFGARKATFDVVQLQSGKSAQVKITTLKTAAETGVNFIDGYANDTTVAITNVRVINIATGLVIENSDGTVNDTTITISNGTFASGVANITGVKAGYRIEYTTTDDHNRLLVENGAALNASGNTHADFDIGGFKLVQASTETIEIGSKISFEDDGPSITVGVVATADALTVDETDLSADITAEYSDNFANTPSYGADDAGSISSVYALSVKTAGADSGLLDVASGYGVFLYLEAGQVVARVGSDPTTPDSSGAVSFTVSVNSTTGTVTLDQKRAMQHPDASNPDDAVSPTAADLISLSRTDTITDKDGDQSTDSSTINIAATLSFEDDGPTILTKTDLVYANASNPAPGGTGIFDYATGADARLAFASNNSDFSAITLTGTVGVTAISSSTVTWFSETLNTAVFNVAFNYQPDPASTATTAATGTLTFNKVSNTYTVALAQPISGFSTLTTANALGFTGYSVDTSTIDQTQPDVSVAKLSTDFFVQFTGISEPGGGTDTNNLQALEPAVNLDGANGSSFVPGELFKQAATWVSVSNAANGTAGDTIQKGEVLDLDFFNTNPTGFTSLTPTTQASGIFLKFDGVNSEDLVVVLKLVDPDDMSRTTKAIIIDNADIIKFGGTVPAGYNIVLDNNDGAVIIENNDFNTGSENYLIEGAQLLVSTEGVTGTAINLNPSTGPSGGSTTTQDFGAVTTDSDVIKISDIGFVTAKSGTLNANLSFKVAVVDADGDATSDQTLNVSLISGASLSPTSSADAFSFTDADTDGLLAGIMYNITVGFATGIDKLDFPNAGSLSNYAENLVVAADVSAFITAADTALNGTVRYYFGVAGSDGYLATDTDGNGITSIVKLAGVTDMAFSDIA